MFTDPQSVTVNAVAQSLPRTSTDNTSSSYTKDDETYALTISHIETKNNRIRHSVRLDFNEVAADPFVSGNSRKIEGSTYLIIDEPSNGEFTNANLLLKVKGLVGWLSDANVTKVLAGES